MVATVVSTEKIKEIVDRVLGTDPALARKVKLYLYHSYTTQNLKEIGMRFGIRNRACLLAGRRMTLGIEHDAGLRTEITQIMTLPFFLIKKKIGLQNV